MQYRTFTKDRLSVSSLGFGCMRFPTIHDNSQEIDYYSAMKMIDYAIANGINYLDTAWPYHNGQSEEFLGQAIEKHSRGNIYLATKMPMWLCSHYEDYEKFFKQQLKKLKTDYIDFYLTHSLGNKSFENMLRNNVFQFLDQKKKSGEIRYTGFSFHGQYDLFPIIVDSYPWDFCQIQLNYMDVDYQAGLKGMSYAGKKGLSIVVMEPVKGGKLAKSPAPVKELFAALEKSYSPSQWALQWVLDYPEISVALSGMSSVKQLKENIKVASETKPNQMTEKEKKVFQNVKKYYENRIQVECTNCEYCLPCNQGVAIPTIFEYYNNAFIYDQKEINCRNYKQFLIDKQRDASQCIGCGHCEFLCPQHLTIVEKLREANEFLNS